MVISLTEVYKHINDMKFAWFYDESYSLLNVNGFKIVVCGTQHDNRPIFECYVDGDQTYSYYSYDLIDVFDYCNSIKETFMYY